jgi:hypothetical protein
VRTWLVWRAMSVTGGEAESICSARVFPGLTLNGSRVPILLRLSTDVLGCHSWAWTEAHEAARFHHSARPRANCMAVGSGCAETGKLYSIGFSRQVAQAQAIPLSRLLPWCCRAEARLALTRPASTKHWRRRAYTLTGSAEFRLEASTPRQQLSALFNHLVGALQERFRYREAERLGGFEIDD